MVDDALQNKIFYTKKKKITYCKYESQIASRKVKNHIYNCTIFYMNHTAHAVDLFL